MNKDRRKFLRQLLLSGGAITALSACGGSSNSSIPHIGQPDSTKEPSPNGPSQGIDFTDELAFLVIGDMGTGNDGQYKVARAMEAVIAEKGADFVLCTGDNIYEQGVSSADDLAFLEKFEYPYQNINLPFYLCLGNHDNACTPLGGGSFNYRGNYQVDYHYKKDRYSNKWKMPARYYTHRFGGKTDKPFLELFVVDSNPLTSFYQDADPKFSWPNYGYPQQRWMRKKVQESNAHWKLAMSHVPYLSNGKHGNAGNLDADLRWLFSSPDADGMQYKLFIEECFKDKVDVLFTGHDHVMQWLKPVESMGKTEIIVSGAGGKTDKLKNKNLNPAHFQQENEYGFVWVSLKQSEMTISFYGVNPNSGEYHLNYTKTQTKLIS